MWLRRLDGLVSFPIRSPETVQLIQFFLRAAAYVHGFNIFEQSSTPGRELRPDSPGHIQPAIPAYARRISHPGGSTLPQLDQLLLLTFQRQVSPFVILEDLHSRCLLTRLA
jgi:hypothetical protein